MRFFACLKNTKKFMLAVFAVFLAFVVALPAEAAYRIEMEKMRFGEVEFVEFDGLSEINEELKMAILDYSLTCQQHMDEALAAGLPSYHASAKVSVHENGAVTTVQVRWDESPAGSSNWRTFYYVFNPRTQEFLNYEFFVGEITREQLFVGIKSGLLKITDEDSERTWTQTDGISFDGFYVSDNFLVCGWQTNDEDSLKRGGIKLVYPRYVLADGAFGEAYIFITPELAARIKKIDPTPYIAVG